MPISDFDRPEATGEDERRRLRVGDTDDRDLHTAHVEHLPLLDTGEVVLEVPEVGRDVLELGEVDHLLEVVDSPVEVVVSERVDLEAHEIHRLDRRLFVEEARERRSRPVRVTSREGKRVRVRGPVVLEVRRQLGRSTDVADTGDVERIELGVPVRHVQELECDRVLPVSRVQARLELPPNGTGGVVARVDVDVEPLGEVDDLVDERALDSSGTT